MTGFTEFGMGKASLAVGNYQKMLVRTAMRCMAGLADDRVITSQFAAVIHNLARHLLKLDVNRVVPHFRPALLIFVATFAHTGIDVGLTEEDRVGHAGFCINTVGGVAGITLNIPLFIEGILIRNRDVGRGLNPRFMPARFPDLKPRITHRSIVAAVAHHLVSDEFLFRIFRQIRRLPLAIKDVDPVDMTHGALFCRVNTTACFGEGRRYKQ